MKRGRLREKRRRQRRREAINRNVGEESRSYIAFLNAAAKECRCCPMCSQHPCPAVCAGGVCDNVADEHCRCCDDDFDDFDDYRDDEDYCDAWGY